MSAIHSLRELLIGEMKLLLDAEMQQAKVLPGLAAAAANAVLLELLVEHGEQTRTHCARLEQALGLLAVSGRGHTGRAMKGLVAECIDAGGLRAPAPIRDAALIGAIQRIEHYEIAAYGAARAFAEQLAEEEIVDLLQATIEEEAEADRRLTIVSAVVNADARVAHPAAA